MIARKLPLNNFKTFWKFSADFLISKSMIKNYISKLYSLCGKKLLSFININSVYILKLT